MNYIKHLQAAGVPEHYHTAAIASLQGARGRAKGLVWAKWRVRLFKAGKIAKLLPWNAERLLDVRNDLGLLSEEYDPASGRLLGNFPQAFSHVGLINTALNLVTRRGPAHQRAAKTAVSGGIKEGNARRPGRPAS